MGRALVVFPQMSPTGTVWWTPSPVALSWLTDANTGCPDRSVILMVKKCSEGLVENSTHPVPSAWAHAPPPWPAAPTAGLAYVPFALRMCFAVLAPAAWDMREAARQPTTRAMISLRTVSSRVGASESLRLLPLGASAETWRP